LAHKKKQENSYKQKGGNKKIVKEDLFKDFRVECSLYDFLVKSEKDFVRDFFNWIRKNKRKTLLKTKEVNTRIEGISYLFDVDFEDLKTYEKGVLNKKW